ncbi:MULTISPECIES: NAD(P)/FAD-dependent oxidoreductase [Pseudomonas]|uniref:FAD-dependent oxidoreductase n=1 Tax=Pseudomonas sessilinigenes TaxID=658629 RepID=A0ABX8MJ73_9PSED|nr:MULTISPECIES: FAD-dependent oxidoreductase [Pseudomonas]AZC18542.1 Ferredoxin reductase [Pseudomonas sp. CMR5c]AZC26644.1 Ferredoxin reductase [Pseudomonas sessilinigenes]QXH39365.1 FAD-dependent oxidoreductase [Pseudomonas sessilinigenes]
MNDTCIIVGASHAGIQLAIGLRQEGWQGRILLLGEEACLPYHRPPLSKSYLKNEADLAIIHPQASLDKHEIEFLASTRVVRIDRQVREVLLDNQQRLAYTKLALCTGASPRRLSIEGSDLQGVHYLRDHADADRLRTQLPGARNVVIIGAGYIGLETAASLRQLGLQVCVLEAAPRILGRSVDEPVSAFFEALHQDNGVTIRTSCQVSQLVGKEHVEAVLCTDGTHYPADIVVIGVGVKANVGLAEDAGLAVDDGILVDSSARTSDAEIVAAGDCTRFPSAHLQRLVRLECLANASDQARVAAATLCGHERRHDALPWFWSDQYATRLQIAGVVDEYERVVQRGDIATGSFCRFYLRDAVVLSALCVNRPKEFIACKRLIATARPVDPTKLADESCDINVALSALPA